MAPLEPGAVIQERLAVLETEIKNFRDQFSRLDKSIAALAESVTGLSTSLNGKVSFNAVHMFLMAVCSVAGTIGAMLWGSKHI